VTVNLNPRTLRVFKKFVDYLLKHGAFTTCNPSTKRIFVEEEEDVILQQEKDEYMANKQYVNALNSIQFPGLSKEAPAMASLFKIVSLEAFEIFRRDRLDEDSVTGKLVDINHEDAIGPKMMKKILSSSIYDKLFGFGKGLNCKLINKHSCTEQYLLRVIWRRQEE